jgi:hypothetical protein
MDQGSHHRQDRVLPLTRWTTWLVMPVLLVAGVMLYFAPGETDRLWSWSMGPEMTAMAVGGGYLAGAAFFLRAGRTSEWHRLWVGIGGASVLSGLLLVATVLHWDLFNHGHVSFWAWLSLYLVTPFLLPALLVVNGRQDPGASARGHGAVPVGVRAAVALLGLVQLGVAAVMFVAPSIFVDRWPWSLTPLTARTLSAFLAFIAVVWLAFAVEKRWSALELPVQAAWLGLALVGVAGVVQRDQITEEGTAGTVAFTAILLTILVGLAAVQALMWSRRHGSGPATAGVEQEEESESENDVEPSTATPPRSRR